MDVAEFADQFTTQMQAHLDQIEHELATTPAVTRLADIPGESLEWLWPGWIPSGALTILGGHVGDGKSTVIAALAAALTTGAALPDGATVPPVNVLIISAEDDPARVIRPRLDVHNADPERIFIMSPIDLQQQAEHLRRIITQQQIGLVVIDPLGCILRRVERGGESEIRTALKPLMDIIAGTSVAALGVMRVGKTGRVHRPAQRLVGSSAVPALARSVIMVARDDEHPEDDENVPGRSVLQVVKSNYATAPQPLALRLDPAGPVQWLGPAATGIDDRAEDRLDRRLSRSERADAASFLTEYLKDGGIEANQVLRQAKRLGFSEITIRRTKKDLGITSRRTGYYGSSWKWELPKEKEDDQPRRGKRS